VKQGSINRPTEVIMYIGGGVLLIIIIVLVVLALR
jgi:hypothetical protein